MPNNFKLVKHFLNLFNFLKKYSDQKNLFILKYSTYLKLLYSYVS